MGHPPTQLKSGLLKNRQTGRQTRLLCNNLLPKLHILGVVCSEWRRAQILSYWFKSEQNSKLDTGRVTQTRSTQLYVCKKDTHLCNASRMFLNLPSDETRFWSLEMICLVCLVSLSQVLLSLYIELFTNAAHICNTPLKLWVHANMSAIAVHFSIQVTLSCISGFDMISVTTSWLTYMYTQQQCDKQLNWQL